MSTARAGHTATLLSSGKVLVTGRPIEVLATAEPYDPTTGSFAATGRMATARWGHTATLLSDGRVLVTGGYVQCVSFGCIEYPPSTASAELYDPSTGSFSPAGSMNGTRASHTATLLSNGKVLVVGGYDNSAELYDPSTGSFTGTSSSITARQGHTATLLSDGKVLVVGGYDADSAELYDPSTGSFTATSSMMTARQGHSATLLSDGRVLVAGGLEDCSFGFCEVAASAELYSPSAGSFSATGSMTTSRQGHSATLLSNGKVLGTCQQE